ncbi:MAG: glycosyltransferase family 4 protein [Planctomycetota bacterium]
MRIAHVITRMIIGGAQENTLLNCLDLIDDFGDEVLLICGPSTGPEGNLLEQQGVVSAARASGDVRDESSHSDAGAGQWATQIVADRLPVRCIDSLRRNIHPWHDASAALELRRVISRFAPDVVHTHSAKGGLLGRMTAWQCDVPAVVHSVHGAPFHDYQSALARAFFIRCERWAARRCHHMICVADAMTDLMVDAGVAPRTQFTTVFSGMDVQPFVDANLQRDGIRSQFGFRASDIVIGKIARLFHLKGHDDLVSAASQVVAANPNVRFLLVGDGLLRDSLQQRIDSEGLTNHFVFAGLVDPSRVPALIGGMDVLVHASYREGLARALPQALLAGKPVVSYDVDGAREVAIDGVTGRLVPAGDINGLANAMTMLASDADRRQQYGRAGQSRFLEQFRHQTMTRYIRQIYQETLDRA